MVHPLSCVYFPCLFFFAGIIPLVKNLKFIVLFLLVLSVTLYLASDIQEAINDKILEAEH